jgi:hypothetical protein
MHGYGDINIKNVVKLVMPGKLEGKMSFLNSWTLEFVVIECYLKKSHFLMCYVCHLYDARIDLDDNTQIYCKGEDFGLRKRGEKFSNCRNGLAVLRNN